MPIVPRSSAPGLPARVLAGMCACLWLVCGPTLAQAQTLATGAVGESVVARLVAWRTASTRPVRLEEVAPFAWDRFEVQWQPAGDSMTNCNAAGLMPCSLDMQPEPNQQVQVLVFLLDGASVYHERIMVRSGDFAEPLPHGVTRATAMLVTCPADGRMLWCVAGSGLARIPDPFLDGN